MAMFLGSGACCGREGGWLLTPLDGLTPHLSTASMMEPFSSATSLTCSQHINTNIRAKKKKDDVYA